MNFDHILQSRQIFYVQWQWCDDFKKRIKVSAHNARVLTLLVTIRLSSNMKSSLNSIERQIKVSRGSDTILQMSSICFRVQSVFEFNLFSRTICFRVQSVFEFNPTAKASKHNWEMKKCLYVLRIFWFCFWHHMMLQNSLQDLEFSKLIVWVVNGSFPKFEGKQWRS